MPADLTAADLACTGLRSHYHDLAADLLDPADLAQGDIAHAMHVALVDALVSARMEGRAEALRRGRLEGAEVGIHAGAAWAIAGYDSYGTRRDTPDPAALVAALEAQDAR